jgi:hypothetical protein
MTRFLRRQINGSCVGLLALACGALQGQTPTPTAVTCTTPPTTVVTFSIERVLTLTDVLTTLTPNLPANIVSSITSGAQEIREKLVYDPKLNTLTSTVFLVAPGSPNPTPGGVDLSAQTIARYRMSIDRIYTSCSPYPSVMFVGVLNLSAGGPNDPTGVYNVSLTGDPAVVSIGYTTDDPPKINNVVELFAGAVVSFSAAANGTVTFPPSAVTPPGTTGPSIVLNITIPATGRIQLFSQFFHLDASRTTDPDGLPVTFQWAVTPPVSLTPSLTAAAIDIQFPALGDYTVVLTATNSAGKSNTVTIPLQVLGRLP